MFSSAVVKMQPRTDVAEAEATPSLPCPRYPPPLPLLRSPAVLSFKEWKQRYGYFVDEIVQFTLERLPAVALGGHEILWDPCIVRDNLARLSYQTSVNRYRRFVPVL